MAKNVSGRTSSRFRKIVCDRAVTAMDKIEKGRVSLHRGRTKAAINHWKSAFRDFQWILLNVIQRRILHGKRIDLSVERAVRRLTNQLSNFGRGLVSFRRSA